MGSSDLLLGVGNRCHLLNNSPEVCSTQHMRLGLGRAGVCRQIKGLHGTRGSASQPSLNMPPAWKHFLQCPTPKALDQCHHPDPTVAQHPPHHQCEAGFAVKTHIPGVWHMGIHATCSIQCNLGAL